jgi:hypothetical protein
MFHKIIFVTVLGVNQSLMAFWPNLWHKSSAVPTVQWIDFRAFKAKRIMRFNRCDMAGIVAASLAGCENFGTQSFMMNAAHWARFPKNQKKILKRWLQRDNQLSQADLAQCFKTFNESVLLQNMFSPGAAPELSDNFPNELILYNAEMVYRVVSNLDTTTTMLVVVFKIKLPKQELAAHLSDSTGQIVNASDIDNIKEQFFEQYAPFDNQIGEAFEAIFYKAFSNSQVAQFQTIQEAVEFVFKQLNLQI